MKAEQMTVEQMVEALGLTRHSKGYVENRTLVAWPLKGAAWTSWPCGKKIEDSMDHPTEHAALLRLYRLRFPKAEPTPTAAPVVEPEPAQATEQTMTPTEALGILETYAPCEHSSYDDSPGDGETWVKCYDCGATVERIRLDEAAARARDFDRASWVLDRLIASKQHEPAQAGGNVAIVRRAYDAWKAEPASSVALDAGTERAFGEMLAEAYVADARGQS